MSSDSEDEMQDWNAINAKILKRGEKDHAPDGTTAQISCLEQSRTAMYTALSHKITTSPKNLVECDWINEKNVARIRKLKGNFFNTMGYMESGNMYLRPEELIYLCQRGTVVCYYNDILLSLEKVMELALPIIGNTDDLLVYSYLKRLGYTVQRARVYSKNVERTPFLKLLQKGYNSLSLFPLLKASADSLLWFLLCFNHTKLAWKPFYSTYKSVYHDLCLIKAANLNYHPLNSSDESCFTYDVWKPSTKFRKSSPPEPDFRIVVVSALTPFPSINDTEDIFVTLEPVCSTKKSVITRVREGQRRYIYAVVDNGIISFVNTSQTLFEPCINEVEK